MQTVSAQVVKPAAQYFQTTYIHYTYTAKKIACASYIEKRLKFELT